jgi:palmitoyltransferase
LKLGAIAASAAAAMLRVHAAVAAAPAAAGGMGLTLLWPVAFVVFDLLLLVSVAALAVAQGSQVARNVTTNELANWHRYRYLHGRDAEFHNPFDHGCKANCAEVCSPGDAPQAPYTLGGGGGGGEVEVVPLLKG